MRRGRFKSGLDAAGIVALSIALLFFLMSAVSYLLSVIIFSINEGPPPLFTLGDIGTIFGIVGMTAVPLFILMAVLAGIRDRRNKTGNDIDDTPKHRTAKRGRSDRED